MGSDSKEGCYGCVHHAFNGSFYGGDSLSCNASGYHFNPARGYENKHNCIKYAPIDSDCEKHDLETE